MYRWDENLELYHMARSESPSSIDTSAPDVEDVETKASSITDEDDVPELDEVKEVLRDHLDNIEGGHDWATWGKVSDEVDPGITLGKSGVVGLPLSTYDASRIRQESKLKIRDQETSGGAANVFCQLSADHFKLRIQYGKSTFRES